MSAQPFSGQVPGGGVVRLEAEREPAQRITMLMRAGRPAAQLIMAHSPDDPRAEELRALRTELLMRRAPEGPDVLALLSPCPGEGRSQLAAELAIAYAQLGRSTLLIDADLRHPQQHVLFGVDDRLGLSNAVRRGVAPRLHAVEGLPDLFLVTAGANASNPLEVLLHERFAHMLDEWCQSFEFVVLDTPAITPYSDGIAVASLVGRVLAVTRAQHTPYDDTHDMFRRLGAARAEVLGAVISHF
jgi:receptor protein-tyrosine kinase